MALSGRVDMKYELCVCESQHMSSIELEIELMWTRNRSRRMTQFSNLFVIRTFATSFCDVFWFLYSFFLHFDQLCSFLFLCLRVRRCNMLNISQLLFIIMFRPTQRMLLLDGERERETECHWKVKEKFVCCQRQRNQCKPSARFTTSFTISLLTFRLRSQSEWIPRMNHYKFSFLQDSKCHVMCYVKLLCNNETNDRGTSGKHSFTFHLWIVIFFKPICHWPSSPNNWKHDLIVSCIHRSTIQFS